ncbi:Pycsar system effector family protein [Rhodococcus koreensis]
MTQQDTDSPQDDNAVVAETQREIDPDHAWKLLSLVNEWIRHADAKATATLAFTGALGTLLYNLVKNQTDTGATLDIFAVLTCIALGLALLFCGLTLAPRIQDHKDQDNEPDTINRIFFGSITKHYDGRRPAYRDVVKTLTEDPHELIRDLADQIHTNARIATTKSHHAQRAIRSLLAAGVCLAVVAILIAH